MKSLPTTALLARLMAFKPVSAEPARVNALVDFLADILRRGGLHVAVGALGGRKILFAATRRTRAPALLLNAHLDVLPAPDALFTLRRKGPWLTGRGTDDCLGNCAVIVRALLAAGPGADAGALFSTDEELGGQTAAHMVARGYRGTALVVVMDGPGYALGTAQKGILTVRLRAAGKACHSSTPWRGVNAIDRVMDAYARVRRAFPGVREGDAWHNTLSATMIRAGTACNLVPDAAELTLNIRYTETTRPSALLKTLRRLSGLAVDVIGESPALFCDARAPALRALRALMQRSLRRPIPLHRMNGATDARHFRSLRVPMAILGLPGSGAHGLEERVSAAALPKYEALLHRLITAG